MDEKSHLLEQAERCRRIAEEVSEPSAAAALRTLAEEYERKAASTSEPSHHDATIEDADESVAATTGDENALTILREFEQARVKLVGKTVVLSDGKAGTINRVYLDELHGLRSSIEGHDGQWPISTVKFSECP